MMRCPCTLVAAIAAGAWLSGPVRPARACEEAALRDAAFTGERDLHRLCVIANEGDPQAEHIHEKLRRWLSTAGAGLNLELTRVAADAPDVRWQDLGIPSAPPSMPVVVLFGYRTFERKSFYVDHWEPGPTEQDLEQLRTSPVREKIRQEAGGEFAILLYILGEGSRAGRAGPVLDAVVTTWSSKTRLGLSVIRVDRSDPRERVLLSFVGLGDDPTADWVSVLVGRGKRMRALHGSEITEANLNEQLELLLQACTCVRSPLSLGVDLPMVWNTALDASVAPLREPAVEPAATAAPVATAPAPPRAAESRILATTIWTLAAVALLVAGGTAVMLWFRRQAS